MADSRPISSKLRNSSEASATGDFVCVFIDITHPDLAQTIRVVSEDDRGISYANGKVINYRLDGEVYLGTPFSLSWPSDGDRPAEARASIPNIDRALSDRVKGLTSPPQFRIRCILASEFDNLYDADNARNPIATPVVDLDADYLMLRDVHGDPMLISGRIAGEDYGAEPCPPIRTTEQEAEALWW